MRSQRLLPFAFLLAVACETPPGDSVSRVQPEGADRFKVTYGPLWTVDRARVDARDEANRFCAVRNTLMTPDSERTPAMDPNTTFELIFHCEPERTTN